MSEVTIDQTGTLESGGRYAVLAVHGAVDAGSYHDLRQAVVELLALKTHVVLNFRRCRTISPHLHSPFRQVVLAFPRRMLRVCLVSPARKFVEILGDPEGHHYMVESTITDAIETIGGLKDASDDTLRVLKADVNVAIGQFAFEKASTKPRQADADSKAADDVDRAVESLQTIVFESWNSPSTPERETKINTTFLFFADWLREGPEDGDDDDGADAWIDDIGKE